mgnify:CR=1 FL=1
MKKYIAYAILVVLLWPWTLQLYKVYDIWVWTIFYEFRH